MSSGGSGQNYYTQHVYGAVVHVKGEPRFFAGAWLGNAAEAADRALATCQHASGKTCALDMFFERNQCFAAAVGGSYYATARASSESKAKRRALRNCQTDRQRCRVVASGCPR